MKTASPSESLRRRAAAGARGGLVLVQPPLPANERHKRVLPLGLAYLAAYVRDRIPGARVRIVDGQGLNLSLSQVAERAAEGSPAAVGITYWTCQAPAAEALSRMIRERLPRTIVIHGGIHATIFPRRALETADYCVTHEGEETLAELLRFLAGEGK